MPPAPPWSPQTKTAVGVGLVVFASIVLWAARGVFAIAALAALLAFLLGPPIKWLHTKARVPRWLALLLTYFLVLVLTVALGVLVAGSVAASIRELDPLGALESVRTWIVSVVGDTETVRILGIKLDLSQALDPIRGWLEGEGGLPVGPGGGEPVIVITPGNLGRVFGGLLGSVQTVVGLLVAIFTSTLVTLIIAVYLNADSRRFHVGLFRLVPPGYEGDAQRLAARIRRVWTGYMYGQLANSLITGAMVWAVLWFVGLPGAFLMGFIMAILNMIPTIGPILAAIPGILAALIQGTTKYDMNNLVFALLVTAIYIAVVQLQANLIAPRVMGTAVNLRPAVVMIGLIVGLQIAGFLGSLLAVPIIATGREMIRYLYAKLIDRDPWTNWEPVRESPAPDPEPATSG